MKKLLAVFLLLLVSAAVISAVVITTNAFAEETTQLSSNLTITGNSLNDGNDYEYEYVASENGSILTIKSDKQMTISGNTTVDRIVVNSQNGANLIFSDLFVDTSERGDLAAFDIDAGITNKDAVIKVTLKNGTDNTLKSKLHAGLQKSSDVCTLIIEGDGKLAATGGDNSAGIGGGLGGNGTNIIINGGDITATGGTGGAGIGGGENGNGSNIQIYGGIITAKTISGGGAGIGGGQNGKGEHIFISNAKVHAEVKGSGGAGIGGGSNGIGNDIQINGCKGEELPDEEWPVEASGIGGGAGIGGGSGSNGTNIKISGSKVKANGGNSGGAGIGGGYSGSGSGITINGSANVTAEGGDVAAGIGGGANSGANPSGGGKIDIIDNDGNTISVSGITISGEAEVTATGGYYGAGIGGGAGGSGTNITISDSADVTANGGDSAAGIGGGYNGSGTNITISGGTVEATGVDNGAGIGGGNSGSGSGITIKGGAKVTATGGYRGAGIGGGYQGDGSNIIIGDNSDSAADIANRVVIAKSEGAFAGQNGEAAGIGGGAEGNGDTITIYNGTVTAESNWGAGIGGGNSGNGINITINGGKITATSNESGAGIGGGRYGGCGSDIKITGGDITAECTFGGGAGIGGGNSGSAQRITINNGTVKAIGTGGGAGIGGGGEGNGEYITITGDAVVTATAAKDNDGYAGGAGIGGGNMGGGNMGGAGTDIEISGNAIVTATASSGGADIGGGSSGVGTNITIKDNADVTVNNNGCAVCIGSCASGASKIDILGGTVTAKDTTGGNTNNTTQFGIGGMAASPVIEISGGAKVNVAASAVAIGSTGSGSVTINGAEVTAVGNMVGINCDSITISGDNTQVTAEGGSLGIGSFMNSSGCTVTITEGTVTSTAADGTGIGGEGSTVNIKGTNSTSYPWVFTNKIESENGNGEYYGIVFDDAHKGTYTTDVDGLGNTYPADGVVYGGEDHTIRLTEPYTLENGKLLRVQKGTTFVTTNENKLTLDSSILYLEEKTTLDKYNKITIINDGEILHEDPSDYDRDSTGKMICDICGKEYQHNAVADWAFDNSYHWHECGEEKDCAVKPNSISVCLEYDSEKDSYGEHVYGVPKKENGMLKYECMVCDYSYSVPIITVSLVKVDENDAPLEGAVFGIYSNADSKTPIETAATAMVGDNAVVSLEARLGGTYYIKETQAPEGYELSDKVYMAIVGADGKVTYGTTDSEDTSAAPLVCKNSKNTHAHATIIKTDDKGAALAGAVFGIYSDETCKTQITTATTAIDNDGASATNGKAIVSFTTEFGNTYYIKEITAPEGYTASDKVYTVSVGADGKITYGAVGSADTSEDIPVCENEKSTAPNTPVPDDTSSDGVKIIKVDSATKNPLAGAQFGLYSDEECTVLITTKTTAIGTDNKAVVSFDAEPNKTYYIKETKAPNGYKISDKVFIATVDTDGKITYGVVGSATTSEDIPICENDAVEVIPAPAKIIKVDGEGNPLAGAEFGIYSDEECTVLITTKTTAIDTDNKAVVSFDTEPSTTYYIKETKAPEGYSASDEVFKAVVDADGKVTYGAVGSADTSENIPVCKNEKSAADTSVPADTPNGVNNPETGVVLGTAGFAILSGIICTVSSKRVQSKRKRKNGDNSKIDF